jgi:hypothetical protein
VLAITTLVTHAGHMRPSTAASLVGAAVLSTLIYPFLRLRLRGDLEKVEEVDEPEAETQAAVP